jgi:hypothetical protein
MVHETQDEDVLVFNLDHDVLVKLRADASMTIEAFGQDTAPMRLTRDQQLLLLDRLCRTFSFPSPIDAIVSHVEVGSAPPAEDDEAYTISPLLPRPGVHIEFNELDLPPLPDVEG